MMEDNIVNSTMPQMNGDYENFTLCLNKVDPALEGFYIEYGKAHGYISTVVSLFGILANIANVVVLSQKNMKSSVNFILTWLAVADLLTMLVYLPMVVHFYIMRNFHFKQLFTTYWHWYVYLLLFSHLTVLCHTIAIWLTITLATFRVIYIRLPAKGPQMCSMERAKLSVALTCAVVAVMCIPNYLQNGYEEAICGNVTTYGIGNSKLAMKYEVIPLVNYWIQAILFKLLPCVLLTLLTILLVQTLHEASQRRQRLKSEGKTDESNRQSEHNRTTGMLLAVAVIFLITELPQGILTILSGTKEGFFQEVYTPLGDLMDILALINNSINFVLYCTMSRQFRNTFFDVFCKWLPKRPACCKKRDKGSKLNSNGKSSPTNYDNTEYTKILDANSNV